MPERRNLKKKTEQQTQERIKQLIEQYPGIKQIDDIGKGLPESVTLSIRVQRANTDMMYFAAKNIIGDDVERHCRIRFDMPDYRGNQLQYLCAVGKDESIVATLWTWVDGFEKESVLKDIFSKVDDPEKIKYLFLVTRNDWFPPEYLSGNYREDKIVRELFVIVFQKAKKTTWSEIITKAAIEKKEREEAYLYFPKEMPFYPGIHQCLKDGWKMHAFSSGGGLRVVLLSKKGEKEEKECGEPHFEEALAYMEEDIQVGGIPCNEKRGKRRPHYLTGDSISTSNIDYWIRRGSTFDVFRRGNKIVFRLNGYKDADDPKEVMKEAESKPGVQIRWKSRGYTFGTVYQHDFFANGNGGWSTRVLRKPFFNFLTTQTSYFYHITKTGKGSDFWEAYKNAVNAPEKEKYRLKTLRSLYWEVERNIKDNLPRWKKSIKLWLGRRRIDLIYFWWWTKVYAKKLISFVDKRK